MHDSLNDLPALLRRLCLARWLWLAAALALTLAGPALLALPLPQLPILAALLLTAAINLATLYRLGKRPAVTAIDIFLQLCVDLTALVALIFFSGGATNPLISLLLPLLAVAALVLPPALVAAYTLLAVASYSALMVWYLPLPLNDPARAARLHLAGMWLTFAVSALLMAWLLLRMTGRIRERDAALATAREQALREERVVALGALAAGAAHELGTPLASMALLAGELAQETGLSAAGQEDVATLRKQIAECKQILTTLSARAGVERAESAMGLDTWLRAVRERWLNLRPGTRCTLTLASGPAPTLLADATLEQALVNLLNNAARAATSEISLAAAWDDKRWRVTISDDGPGFPEALLAAAGQQPLPAHAEGSGLGLWLSVAAVERLGGRLTFHNQSDGGAAACIEFPCHA